MVSSGGQPKSTASIQESACSPDGPVEVKIMVVLLISRFLLSLQIFALVTVKCDILINNEVLFEVRVLPEDCLEAE